MEREATAVVTREPADATIDVGPAIGTWAASWTLGTIVAAPIIISVLGASLGDDLTIPQLSAVSLGAWAAFSIGLLVASRRFGTGVFLRDYAVRFRPVDAIGIPVGVATQLALVPLLYVPLRGIWPDTFSTDQIEERAQDLADRAGGWLTVLLAVVVVIGAPIIEELVYRGLLQRSTSRAIGVGAGLVLTSLFSPSSTSARWSIRACSWRVWCSVPVSCSPGASAPPSSPTRRSTRRVSSWCCRAAGDRVVARRTDKMNGAHD